MRCYVDTSAEHQMVIWASPIWSSQNRTPNPHRRKWRYENNSRNSIPIKWAYRKTLLVVLFSVKQRSEYHYLLSSYSEKSPRIRGGEFRAIERISVLIKAPHARYTPLCRLCLILGYVPFIVIPHCNDASPYAVQQPCCVVG